MGYYIETDAPKGKAQYLADRHEAEILPQRPATFDDIPEGMALICIVDNGPFEAAALCFSAQELQAFDAVDDVGPSGMGSGVEGIPTFTLRSEYQERGDQRPRTWLLMDKAVAHQLAGYREEA